MKALVSVNPRGFPWIRLSYQPRGISSKPSITGWRGVKSPALLVNRFCPTVVSPGEPVFNEASIPPGPLMHNRKKRKKRWSELVKLSGLVALMWPHSVASIGPSFHCFNCRCGWPRCPINSEGSGWTPSFVPDSISWRKGFHPTYITEISVTQLWTLTESRWNSQWTFSHPFSWIRLVWTRRGQDLNLHSPNHEPGELTNYSTPRSETIFLLLWYF